MPNKMLICVLAWALVIGVSSCGQDGGYDTVDMTLSFSTLDLPEGVQKVRYFVLPAILSDQTEIDCFTFFDPDPANRKSIYDYNSEFLKHDEVTNIEVTTRIDVSIKDLPEGLLIFYVELLDAGSNVLACGCGKGHIEEGKKTVIPIGLLTDC